MAFLGGERRPEWGIWVPRGGGGENTGDAESDSPRAHYFASEKGAEMVLEELPENVVERLRKSAEALDRHLGLLENIDHRKGLLKKRTNTRYYGGRVRQLDLTKKFPGFGTVVLKRLHGWDFEQTRETIRERINKYNEHFKNKSDESRAILIEPKAYDVGNGIAAMTKTNLPNVTELGLHRDYKSTERGRKFLENLKNSHGISEEQIKRACEEVSDITAIQPSNLLFVGLKKRQFVFVPLFDWR